MLQDFWHNFTHNLFKPLLLFFYFGFLIPIRRCGSNSLCHLPRPDDVLAAGHRVARSEELAQRQRLQRRGHRGIHGARFALNS